ncbi:MAG: OsmC family peroxiredoxin [Thermotogae bacterium]|nr:OsmC family protein [Thermotogaceae bacterium]RKX37607.1 MAG: OsmC family peroxiredoxin [Thermotogota bacterium]
MKTHWLGKMMFIGHTDSDHKVLMDAKPQQDTMSGGPSPMELLLTALTGCTGMDVISILSKMKVVEELVSFQIEAEAERSQEHPKVYKKILLKYIFKFSGEPPKDKVQKAVELSQEKYCSVSAMLGKTADISFEIVFA